MQELKQMKLKQNLPAQRLEADFGEGPDCQCFPFWDVFLNFRLFCYHISYNLSAKIKQMLFFIDLVEALVVTTIQSILEQLKQALTFLEVEEDKAKVFDILAELAKSGRSSAQASVFHSSSYPPKNRGGEWSFKKSGSRKIFAKFQGSRSLVFSADLGSRSLDFFCNAVSESRFLRRVRSQSLDFFRNAVSQSRVILRLHDDKVACGVR